MGYSCLVAEKGNEFKLNESRLNLRQARYRGLAKPILFQRGDCLLIWARGPRKDCVFV